MPALPTAALPLSAKAAISTVKCLAAVPLPDYPIKEMRTGQHIPGQGDLWSARLSAAP